MKQIHENELLELLKQKTTRTNNFMSAELLSENLKLTEGKTHFLKTAITAGTITAIDGGNATIINTDEFAVEIIRTASVKLINETVSTRTLLEGYAIINGSVNETATWNCNVMGDISFNLEQPIKFEGTTIEMTAIGGFARRIFELKHAKQIAETLTEGEILLLDGSFDTKQHDKKIFEDLMHVCLKKEIILLGITKKTELTLANGANALRTITKRITEKMQYYHPWLESTDGKFVSVAVKLNEIALHTFRIDILKKQETQLQKALEKLAAVSNDIIFPGYPYPLIEADGRAQITNTEKSRLTLLWKARLEGVITATETTVHNILNKIR